MTIYNTLKKLFTIGLAASLIAFALSFMLSLFDNKSLNDLVAFIATLILALTPLTSVVFIAISETKRRSYEGLMMAVLVILIILVSLMLMLARLTS
ncbi:MAG: hypothetical protein QE164_04785 [Candidatus Nezhaarchaeota archaeon]|nr:hypothetical protein [Candidatus Nezhaarchaeota archaeon]